MRPSALPPTGRRSRHALERRREYLRRQLADQQRGSDTLRAQRQELQALDDALACIEFVRGLQSAAHQGRIIVLTGPSTGIEELDLDAAYASPEHAAAQPSPQSADAANVRHGASQPGLAQAQRPAAAGGAR